MTIPRDWQGQAFNTSPHSDNRIHSDEMAKVYGFRGGLVPGVVVSAYLVNPAVVSWGRQWLKRGHARVVVHKPTYCGEDFSVRLSAAGESGYQAGLFNPEGIRNASAEVSLADMPGPLPSMRGDRVLATDYLTPAAAPTATPEIMRDLQAGGMGALEVRWDQDNAMASYLRDPQAMPRLHQAVGGFHANAAFMLALTNWVLAANVSMNPWIHLQTESQNFGLVNAGDLLRVECSIRDLFSRKGHEFVDLDVEAYVVPGARPVMAAQMRAIYRVRPAE